MANFNSSRVLVIYTHFPHYREPVFAALSRSTRFQFEFHYDFAGIEPTIVSGLSSSVNHRQMKTRKFGPFLWQSGALLQIFRDDVQAIILLGNPFILSTWLASIAARMRGIPVFFWTHGWVRNERGMKDRLRCAFYRLANGLMLYGERAKTLGVERGFPADTLYVIGNSLDYEKQAKIRDFFLENPTKLAEKKLEKPYFLTVARLVESAGIDLAIEGLAVLNSDVALMIVGDGPCRPELEALARERGVDVRFEGALYSEEDLAHRFMNCVAVVSPGKVGLLAMHALAYGAPVITHGDPDRQMPEFEIIQDGITGALFAFADTSDLAEKMKAMLAQVSMKDLKDKKYATAIATIESGYTPWWQVEFIEAALERWIKTHA